MTFKEFIRSRILSFRHAFRGWRYVLKTQYNAWIHAIVAVIVFILALWLELPARDWAILILTIAMVFAAAGEGGQGCGRRSGFGGGDGRCVDRAVDPRSAVVGKIEFNFLAMSFRALTRNDIIKRRNNGIIFSIWDSWFADWHTQKAGRVGGSHRVQQIHWVEYARVGLGAISACHGSDLCIDQGEGGGAEGLVERARAVFL
jgi:hypothetical protein